VEGKDVDGKENSLCYIDKNHQCTLSWVHANCTGNWRSTQIPTRQLESKKKVTPHEYYRTAYSNCCPFLSLLGRQVVAFWAIWNGKQVHTPWWQMLSRFPRRHEALETQASPKYRVLLMSLCSKVYLLTRSAFLLLPSTNLFWVSSTWMHETFISTLSNIIELSW
jgi:hypothetical protein